MSTQAQAGTPATPDTASTSDTQVAIIGAGPVGTALAVDLALSGINVIVLEDRAEGQRPHPGTNLTNMRSMEHMRRWGATDHLAAANPLGADVARDVSFVTRGDGHLLLNMPGVLGFTERLPFTSAAPRWGPQSSIETGLRARLAELPSATIRWNATFQSYEELEDHVVVHYKDGDGETQSVSAVYLVGTDGSRSAVRRQAGIRMEGSPRLAHFAAWYLRSPELADLLAANFGRAAFYWFANEDETGVILMAQDSDGLFQFFDGPLPADADGANWDYMRQRLFSAVGREVEVEIVEPSDFWVNSLVAPAFQSGRVLLAGESCHHVSVFGGFGMNLGVGDAADLGWKLAGTLKGWAGPGLLASYSAERVPVVQWIRDLTEESTNHVGMSWTVPGMEADTDEGARIRAEIGRQMAEDKQKELVSLGAQFGAAYRASPVVVPDGTEPPPATFGEFVPSAAPGARAPHLWLDDGRSLYDEVAHEGFTLLHLDPAASITGLVDAAAARGVPLRVVELGHEPGHADARATYGAAMALIRPDHYVAWRGPDAPADPLAVIDRIRGAGDDPVPPAPPTSPTSSTPK
jgi:2-polyprenyl-6-methoxyphenol hydroxylase-like FAD-dependent oxidoreductase